MTLFGKVLLGLILATAAVLVIKGAMDKGDVVVVPEESPVENTDPATAPQDEQVAIFEGSTKELMARGGNHKCTFTQDVENSKSTGTVYISGVKLRGDFLSAVTAGGSTLNVESHMISDGAFMWTWSSMMPTGFKTKVDQTASADTSKQGFDANQKLEYTCMNWTPDEGQFVLPTTVTFAEISI